MASQIAHIIYAQKYLKKHPMPNGDEEKFVLGCIFPDIRRIDETIQRKDTHLRFEPIDLDFSGLTAFESGWKFHLYCDMKREEILNNYNFYKLPGTADFWNQAAKILEDEILYSRYNNWEKLLHYFNNAPDIESLLNVSRLPNSLREALENNASMPLWYAITAKYIEKKPDSKSMKIFLSKQPSWADKAGDIIKSVDKLRENEKVIEVLKKVADEIA